MKRVFSLLLAVTLLLGAVATTAYVASADSILYGDADGNGKINNRDLGLLQKYLNGSNVAIDLIAIDVDDNGKINNRDLGLLQKYLNGSDVTLGPKEPVDPDPPTPPVEPPVPDVPAAALPAVGYDLDGKGRIVVKEIVQEGYLVTVTLENLSSEWMTEETSYVKYTCTDAEGNVLTLEDRYFGTLYLGMLEAKDIDTYTITLPEGTVKLEFGDYRIVYWSQWA